MTTRAPIVRAAGEGERRWFHGGGTHLWKLKADDTDGTLFLFEDTMAQGKVTPLHRHPDTDELVVVLEGEILVHIDGEEHTVVAGGMTYTPRGVPHAFTVVSESARMLSLQTPATAEAFYWDASEPAADDGPGPVDFAHVGQIAQAQGGTEMLGPPPFATPQVAARA
jgi:quercetin dioxygenase-like cupin family protein